MLLAGEPGLPVGDEAKTFQTMRPALANASDRSFRILVAGNELAALETKISLGVENHIRVEKTYSLLNTQGFLMDIPALRQLSDQGPYGASVTVLDMENKKVLGQSVLFASNPVAEFKVSNARGAPETSSATDVIHVSSANLAAPRPVEFGPTPPKTKRVAVWFVIVFIAGVFTACAWRLCRARAI
jgi:hypothetical protein